MPLESTTCAVEPGSLFALAESPDNQHLNKLNFLRLTYPTAYLYPLNLLKRLPALEELLSTSIKPDSLLTFSKILNPPAYCSGNVASC